MDDFGSAANVGTDEAHPSGRNEPGRARTDGGGPSWSVEADEVQLGAGVCDMAHAHMVCAELSRLMFVRPLCLTGQLGSHWQSHWPLRCRRRPTASSVVATT